MQIFVVINLLNLVVLDDDLLIWKLILNIQLCKVLNRLDFGRIHTVFGTKEKTEIKLSKYKNSFVFVFVLTVISKLEKNTFDLKK